MQGTIYKILNILPLPPIYKMEIVYYTKLNISWLENNSIRNDDDT